MENSNKLVNPVCPSCGSREVIGEGVDLEVKADVFFSSTGDVNVEVNRIVTKSLFFITDFECEECGEYWEDRTNINNVLRGVTNAD